MDNEEMVIEQVHTPSPELQVAISRLLTQLSSTRETPTEADLIRFLSSSTSHLLIARIDGGIAGMLTLITKIVVNGDVWAEFEAVVVDENYRRRGIAGALVERGIELARNLGASRIYLTSNSSRQAAHELYKSHGFRIHDTTVFRLQLDQEAGT